MVTPPMIILAMVRPSPAGGPGTPGSREVLGKKLPGSRERAWKGEIQPDSSLGALGGWLSLPLHTAVGGLRGRMSLDLQ